MKRVIKANKSFEAYKGFKVKKGDVFTLEENGDIYKRVFIGCITANNGKNFEIL